MKPSTYLGLCGLAISATVVFAAMGDCAPKPDLPPAVAAAVVRHETLTIVDTAEVARLRRVAERERMVRLALEARARSAELAAVASGRRADTLAAVASTATTPIDSAAAWHAAYDARTIERDSLRVTVAAKDAIIATADRRIAAIDSALDRTVRRAERADSIIVVLTEAAKDASKCRVLRFVPCTTRRQAAVAGVVVGVTSALILTGHIRLPFPTLRRS